MELMTEREVRQAENEAEYGKPPLTCEKEIRVVKRAPTGVVIERYHRKCGRPALVCTFQGDLTSAKATLCEYHRMLAAKQASLIEVSKGEVADVQKG